MNLRSRCLLILLVTFAAAGAHAAQSPYAGGPYAIPGTIQAENYDFGLEGESYHDTTPGNVFNTWRPDGMDVGAIGAGGYHIGYLANGEWAEYTVNVASAGTYNLTYRYSSAYAGATSFRVLLNGAVLTTRSVTSTGSWENYVTQTVSVNIGVTGSRILMIAFDTGAFNLDWVQFQQSVSCTMPNVSDPADKWNVNPGDTVTWNVTATGSPAPTVRWYKGVPGNAQLLSVPNPLSFSITNTEQGKDAGNYFVTATNSCGTDTSRVATIYVPCNGEGPDEMAENINRVLRGTGDRCDWRPHVNPFFADNFGGGKSYNMAVLTNAVAFINAPYGAPGYSWNMDTFWTKYLNGEMGERNQEWFFGGQETFSSDYQKYNLNAVLAVHFEAQKKNKTVIRDLARRWLRASFALLGAGAMPQMPTSLNANGQSQTISSAYVGPYAALGGERTPWGFWTDPNRNVFMARALGIPFSGPNHIERGWQRNIRLWVEAFWPGFAPPYPCTVTADYPCNTNVYGMTSAEATGVRNVLSTNTLPADFVSTYLGTKLRTNVRYNILAWPNVRASLMEWHTHQSTAPTYAIAVFGTSAHFLYPWPGAFTGNTSIYRNVCPGTATLDLANQQMWAEHPQCDNNVPPRLPYQKEFIFGLPAARTSYRIILSRDAAPLIQ